MLNRVTHISFTHRRTDAKNATSRMKLWGILSEDEQKAGFELLLDNDWHVSLTYKGKLATHFDPFDYTMRELVGEIKLFIQNIQSESFWSSLKSTSTTPLPSWPDKPPLKNIRKRPSHQ